MQLPPAVAVRLADPSDRHLFETEGPVDPLAAATVAIQLADLGARAILHGQLSLAGAIVDCLRALPADTDALVQAG